jgi:hypothetical protein
MDGEKGEYIPCCTMMGASGIAWFGLAIWELRGLRRGVERQDVPYTERKRMTLTSERYKNASVERKTYEWLVIKYKWGHSM